MKNGIAIILIVAAAAVGVLLGSGLYTPQIPEIVHEVIQQPYTIDNAGFVPTNISVIRNNVRLRSGCSQISFDVTEDQAFSISRALQGEIGARPLTHDIFIDVLRNFNVTLLGLRIERFDNEIYYARMFLRQSNEILDLDVRPSDAIALALRANQPLYIRESLLFEKGVNIC